MIIVVLFLTAGTDAFAQRGKTTVHHGKNGKKTAVHTNKRGKTTVMHKGKKGNVHVHRNHRKPVRRTKAVHHHYRHLPRRGAVVATVHTSALTFRFGGVGYRFHSGVWYRPQGPKWLVVRPPAGVRIRVLPVGHRKVVIGPNIYYYYYGSYYVMREKEYVVVEAPLGAEVDSLPDGYSTVTADGHDYYLLDDTYYMPSTNESGEEILVAVEDPTR